MTEQEIFEAIDIILHDVEYCSNDYKFYNINLETLAAGSSLWNNTIELLYALYQKLSTDKEKEILLKILESKRGVLPLQKDRSDITRLIFNRQDFVFVFFIRIKKLDKALKIISNYTAITSIQTNLLNALNEILEVEPTTFDDIKLKDILSIVEKFQIFIKDYKRYKQNEQILVDGKRFVSVFNIDRIPYYEATDYHQVNICEELLEKIEKTVYKIKKDRLSAILLEGINYEVNQDQKELQKFIVEFGFDTKLNDVVLKIDEKLYDAKDLFDFKSCIELIRTLLETLCISIAKEIERKKQIPSTDSPINKMGKARAFFRYGEINFLSKEEDDLIGTLYSFLSDKGSHSLQSEQEYARISRNLVIEVGLFLVEKLRKYLG